MSFSPKFSVKRIKKMTTVHRFVANEMEFVSRLASFFAAEKKYPDAPISKLLKNMEVGPYNFFVWSHYWHKIND